MKLSVSFAALALALTAFAQDNKPTIQTPVGAQQCSPIQLMVSGGTPPYTIDAIPVGQAGAPPLTSITSGLQGGTFTWNVNLPGGSSCTLRIRDSAGVVNFSSEVDIQPNPGNSGCLSSSAGGSSTPAGGSSTPASGSTTPAGGSSTSGTSAPSSSAPTSPSSSPATVPSPTSPAATTGGAAGTTSPATRTSASSGGTSPATTSTGAAQQSSNAAVGLTSGSAVGVVGALLAYVLA